MIDDPIKVGVIGVGHLGQHHVKHYKTLNNAELVGIFDIDKKRTKEISLKYDVRVFDDLNALLEEVDALSIVTNTQYHAEIAEICIKNNRHVFIDIKCLIC